MATEIIAAWIEGGSTLLATVIAAIAGALIGKKFSDVQKIKEKLETAQTDIEFLLKVESEHCAIHKAISGESRKNTIRDKVRNECHLEWSGKFTPGRVQNASIRTG